MSAIPPPTAEDLAIDLEQAWRYCNPKARDLTAYNENGLEVGDPPTMSQLVKRCAAAERRVRELEAIQR